jgi:hypothetical protein
MIMGSPAKQPIAEPLLDLSRWRMLPNLLIGAGVVLAVTGAAVNVREFGYSWLLAFMFFLSICVGSLFMVIIHHLFDAGWSVPIRRFLEHIAFLLPVMALLWLPIGLLANQIYPWFTADPHTDHALHNKLVLFNHPMFYVMWAVVFGIWTWLTYNLRKWSILQDRDGAARCTIMMRRYAAGGIFLFAITVTLGCFYWMKSLEHQWFSTMYGVYYFAGSVWLTLATAYGITMVLERSGPLRDRLHEHQYYFLGTLLLAFTVFYAYIHFSQYFLIWNAALPEETFWYVKRENGSWWYVGMVIIFGHFFVPFLFLLRIDAKLKATLMVPVIAWVWLMHYTDMAFNIKPVLHPEGFPFRWVWLDLGCMALIGGVLAKVFLKYFSAHAPLPIKDPRLHEAMGYPHLHASQISGGELDETDGYRDGSLSQSAKNK